MSKLPQQKIGGWNMEVRTVFSCSPYNTPSSFFFFLLCSLVTRSLLLPQSLFIERITISNFHSITQFILWRKENFICLALRNLSKFNVFFTFELCCKCSSSFPNGKKKLIRFEGFIFSKDCWKLNIKWLKMFIAFQNRIAYGSLILCHFTMLNILLIISFPFLSKAKYFAWHRLKELSHCNLARKIKCLLG